MVRTVSVLKVTNKDVSWTGVDLNVKEHGLRFLEAVSEDVKRLWSPSERHLGLGLTSSTVHLGV